MPDSLETETASGLFWACSSQPRGLSPISSGVSRMKMRMTGTVIIRKTMASCTKPARHPEACTVAETMGVMMEPARPEPARAMPMAVPRFSMNQLERMRAMGTPVSIPEKMPFTVAMA